MGMYDDYQWVEDDATIGLPGHECIRDAWKRIFGQDNFEELWGSVKSTEEDGGDAFTRMMPNGIKVMHACDGWYIYKKGI